MAVKKVDHLTTVLEAIGHPMRREILGLLKAGEKPATSIANSFQVSFPAVSQHLAKLKEAGLVSEHRTGRRRIYQLHPRPLKEVLDWVSDYEEFWTKKLDKLGEFLRSKHGKN